MIHQRPGRSVSAREALVIALTTLLVVAAQASAQPAQLGEAVNVRTRSRTEGVKSQQRIDSLSDQKEDLQRSYRETIQQLEALRVYNRQLDGLVGAQGEELVSLRKQIDNVELVGRQITPLMLEMVDALEAFVGLDVPFQRDERSLRVTDLRELMARADVTNSEKFRRILEAYQIENEYGRTIEAYRGTLEDGRTVEFLRVGRVALVYQSLDGADMGVWDKGNGSWIPLDGSYRTSIRQGLRVARKQAAPDMIRLPLPAATQAGGQG
jgi:hypothetical protein